MRTTIPDIPNTTWPYFESKILRLRREVCIEYSGYELFEHLV